MSTSFGSIDLSNGDAALGNRLLLADGPIDLSWHHCGLTSEFLGEFYALAHARSGRDYNEARHSIGYLVNELLENAVKFRAPGDVLIESSLDGGRFEIRVINLIEGDTAERFKGMLADLTARDPGELLIERIEANAEDASSSASGLGLLTLMSDYGARLGWTFRDAGQGGRIRLETLASLDLA